MFSRLQDEYIFIIHHFQNWGYLIIVQNLNMFCTGRLFLWKMKALTWGSLTCRLSNIQVNMALILLMSVIIIIMNLEYLILTTYSFHTLQNYRLFKQANIKTSLNNSIWIECLIKIHISMNYSVQWRGVPSQIIPKWTSFMSNTEYHFYFPCSCISLSSK